jgi:hypothetical protein
MAVELRAALEVLGEAEVAAGVLVGRSKWSRYW